MFNSIRGTVTGRGNGYVCLDNNGLEWRLETSTFSLQSCPPLGEQARVYLHLHVSQDALRLYGFLTTREREIFEELITVSGVGPKAALKILSGATPDRLAAWLEKEDVEALASLPGLGRKTAQKILLHLRGKLRTEAEETLPSDRREIVEALADMGFDRKDAARAVATVMDDPGWQSLPPGEKDQETLRRAIVALSS